MTTCSCPLRAAIRAELAEINNALQPVFELIEATRSGPLGTAGRVVDADAWIDVQEHIAEVSHDAAAGRDRVRAAIERLRAMAEGS